MNPSASLSVAISTLLDALGVSEFFVVNFSCPANQDLAQVQIFKLFGLK